MSNSNEDTFDSTKYYIKLSQLDYALASYESHHYPSSLERILKNCEGLINYGIPNNSLIAQSIPDWIGYTPLHYAVKNFNIVGLEILLKYGADVMIKSYNGFTPLRLTIENSFKRKKRCVELKGILKHSLADCLLAAQINTANPTNPSCKDGISHLHIACMINNVKAVEMFLKANPQLRDITVKTDSSHLPGYTPLHFAVRYCSLESVQILLRYRANINIKDTHGMTPIHLVLKRNIEISNVVIMAIHYDKYLQNSYEVMAEFKVNNAIIDLLLKENYLDNIINKLGLTRLHVACVKSSSASLVEELLKENIDINASISTDSLFYPGFTALHFAAHFDIDTVILLLNNGANIAQKDAKGLTPFDICLEKYEPKVIHSILSTQNWADDIAFSDNSKLLDWLNKMDDTSNLKRHLCDLININATISEDSLLWAGYTRLHLAIVFGRDIRINGEPFELMTDNKFPKSIQKSCYKLSELSLHRISLFMNTNVDITVKDVNGYTPIHLAHRLQKEDIIFTLLSNEGVIENPTDKSDISFFHLACAYGCQRADEKYILKRFLNRGVDVNSYIISDSLWCKTDKYKNYSKSILIKAQSTPLHVSTIFNNIETTTMLLDYGANPLTEDADGFTPLYFIFAISRNENCSLKIINRILSVTPIRPITYGDLSHFHIACYTNNLEIIKRFLHLNININSIVTFESSRETLSARLDSMDFESLIYFEGYTPLHFAAENFSLDAFELLLQNGADICAKNAFGVTPIKIILQKNKAEIKEFFERFLILFSDYDVKKSIGDSGLTILHIASALLDIDRIEKFLQAGVDINSRINSNTWKWSGCTPLHFLIMLNSFSDKVETTIKLLLIYGADITLKNDKNYTPIHVASMIQDSGFNRIVDLLLSKHGTFNNNPSNDEGLTHFHIACMRNNPNIVKIFLKRGFDFNSPKDYFAESDAGYTPLHFAVTYSNKNVVKLLLEHAANVNAEDTTGCNPLVAIARKTRYIEPNYENIEIILREGKVNINATDIFGERAFQLFVNRNTNIEIIKLLLKYGVQINASNPVTLEGCLATIFNSDYGYPHEVMQVILNDAHDLSCLNSNDSGAIHNIVRKYKATRSSDEYVNIIEKLIKSGCKLDGQDDEGRTALHVAQQYLNVPAILGLLMAGANICIVDKKIKTPLEYSLEFRHQTVNLDDNWTKNRHISLIFSTHVRKLIFMKLNVSNTTKFWYEEAQKFFKILKNDEQAKHYYSSELRKMAAVKITETFALNNFISEMAVADYVTLPRPMRESINEIMNSTSDLHRKFPNLGCLLKLQYRKALERLEFIEHAKNSLEVLAAKGLPDPCCYPILRYLKNDDLKI